MPEDRVEWYWRMLPRIEADESLRAIQTLLFAAGYGMPKEQRGVFIRRLEQTAQAEHAKEQPVPRYTPEFFAALGEKVKLQIVSGDDETDGKEVTQTT